MNSESSHFLILPHGGDRDQSHGERDNTGYL